MPGGNRSLQIKPDLSLFFLLGVFILDGLGGCTLIDTLPNPLDNPPAIQPTLDVNALYTSAAETFAVRLTLSAGATAVAQLTQIAGGVLPVATVEPTKTPTRPPVPTQSASPTQLVLQPAESVNQCEQAALVEDPGIPGQFSLPPGVLFQKTWLVQNTGACPWQAGAALVYLSGTRLSAPNRIPLPGEVLPGQMVELVVDFTAPLQPGEYRSSWLLENSQGQKFGLGGSMQNPLQLVVKVAPGQGDNEVAYHLVHTACQAEWYKGPDLLECPGNPALISGVDGMLGSVAPAEEASLETGRVFQPLLLIYTGQASGEMRALYPAFRVSQADHLRLELACQRLSPECSFLFQVDGIREQGEPVNLGAWQKVYDGTSTIIDLDLSMMAGETIQLEFSFASLGEPTRLALVWPRVDNDNPSAEPLLTWHRSGVYTSACDELIISLLSNQKVIAEARECQTQGLTSTAMQLAGADLQQVLYWVSTYKSVYADFFPIGGEFAQQGWMNFRGYGEKDISQNDLQKMQQLSERLFNLITRGR